MYVLEGMGTDLWISKSGMIGDVLSLSQNKKRSAVLTLRFDIDLSDCLVFVPCVLKY